MDAFGRFRPLGEWLWNTIPREDRLAVEAKLFSESHRFPLGEYEAALTVVSGELRGRMRHRDALYPQIAEDGLMMRSPPLAYLRKLKGQDRPSLSGVVACAGMPDIRIARVNEHEGMVWLEFEETGATRRRTA